MKVIYFHIIWSSSISPRCVSNHKTQNIARSFADYRALCKRWKNPTQKFCIELDAMSCIGKINVYRYTNSIWLDLKIVIGFSTNECTSNYFFELAETSRDEWGKVTELGDGFYSINFVLRISSMSDDLFLKFHIK
jgi:hypothetical protein